MEKNLKFSNKPRTLTIRPELTRLPRLTRGRVIFRRLIKLLLQGIVKLAVTLSVQGIENVPEHGPVLMVSNHLGDADAIIGLAISPRPIEAFAKAELYDLPFLGWLMEKYGVIWVHRGQPDRRALRAALDGLRTGRVIGIAPEGRESLTGSLEEATGGAAYLALKSGAPILPVTFTGTQNHIINNHLRHLRRSPVSITVGMPFFIPQTNYGKKAVLQATETIMRHLASQLPVEYQGVYAQYVEVDRERGR